MANVLESDVFELDDFTIEFWVEEPQMFEQSNTEDVAGIVPYRFEPYLSENCASESDSDRTDSRVPRSDNPNMNRLQNIDWCQCGGCLTMPTVRESVCCVEQEKVMVKIENLPEIKCVTQHPNFNAVCLNEDVLETAYYAYKQDQGPYKGNNWKRYTGYRQFIRWCNHYLGKKNHIPIPSCVTSVIR